MLNTKHKILSAPPQQRSCRAQFGAEAPLVPTVASLSLIPAVFNWWFLGVLDGGRVCHVGSWPCALENVTMQLTKNVALFSLAAIFYYLIGYNLMYPLGTWVTAFFLESGARQFTKQSALRRMRRMIMAMRPPVQISSSN